MAEVVGIVAGAVQFLDVGSRVLINLSRFCSDLQHVPRKIKRVRRQLEQTLQLVDSIKSDVEAPNTGPGTTLSGIISQPQVDIAKSLLKDAAVQVTELQVLLDKIAPIGNGFVEKAWRSVVAMKKEEDILRKCSDIETTTGLLQAWMQHQSLTLIRDDLLVDKDSATKISVVDQTLGTVQQSLNDMPKAVESIVQTSQGAVLREIGTHSHHLDENTRRLEQNLDVVKHDVLQGVTTAEASTHRLLQSLKGDIVDEIVLDRTSRSSERQALHSQLASMQQMMNQILIQNTSQRLLSKPSYLKDIESSTLNASSRLSCPGGSLIQSRPRLGTLCTCKTWRTQFHKTWRNFRFRYDPTLAHDVSCPLHLRSKTSWTIGVRATLPALWSYCIDMALQIDFGAGGLSVSPSIRRAARIVDSQTSPVFCALDNLSSYAMADIFYLRNPRLEFHARKVFEAFRTNLCQAFHNGSATAFDESEAGKTVLDEFLGFVQGEHTLLNRLRMYDLIISIIDLLFEGGAEGNPNGILRRRSAKVLPHTPFYYSSVVRDPEYNVDIYGPGIYGGDELLEILQDTDVLAEPDFPPRYTAAIRKSLPLLEASIERNTFEKKHGGLPSVLTFALHWPQGRRLLLAAGADPLESITFALDLGSLDALMDLLHKDVPFFYDCFGFSTNLLREWENSTIVLSDSERNASLILIINHLVQLRRRLLDLARKHLTLQLQISLCIDTDGRQEDIFNCSLLRVYQTLISKGVSVPSFLYPGCQLSMFHLSCINTLAAEQLLRAGFHQFDSQDENGVRPVEIACMKADPKLALWYLQHGAVPHESLIWIIAASFRDYWSHDAVKKIISICGYPESDDCQCHCSSKGCLPSMIVQKQRNYTDLRRWVQYIPKRSQLEAYKEGCRLEVFERLGMSHTCCKHISDPYASQPYHMRQEMPRDDACDIREEEQDFAVILDQYLCLFDHLWLEFTGNFKTYWNAWWSAMAMMLPCPIDSRLACGSTQDFSVDAYWRRHCNTQPGFNFIEEYGPHEKLIRWIVGQYSNVESSLAEFCRLSEPWHVLKSWISYCVAVGIDSPYSGLGYEKTIHLPEDFDMDRFPEEIFTNFGVKRIPGFLFDSPTGRVERAKRYILEKLVPIMIPVIILEIGFGRSIPEDLRRHFEAERLLQDGVLVRSALKDDPASIFEDCFGVFFDSPPF